jgi:hypothetical protein
LGTFSQSERTTVEHSVVEAALCTRSREGKKWVRKEWREERVEEARVMDEVGRFCDSKAG